MVNFLDIVTWASKMSLSWKALTPQNFSNLIVAAMLYNQSIAGLFRAGALRTMLVQTLEKTMIEHSGGMTIRRFFPLSRKTGYLESKEESAPLIPDSRTVPSIRSETDLSKASASKEDLRSSELQHKEKGSLPILGLPPVALLLQNALAYRALERDPDRDSDINHLSRVPKMPGLIFPQGHGESLEFLKIIKRILDTSTPGDDEVKPYLLVNLFRSIYADIPNYTSSIQASGRAGKLAAVSAKNTSSDLPSSSRHKLELKLPSRGESTPTTAIERGSVVPRVDTAERKLTSLDQFGTGIDSMGRSALEQAISLQRMVMNIVYAVAPNATKHVSRQHRPKVRSAGLGMTAAKYPMLKKLLPLESYLGNSEDLRNIVGINPSDRMLTPASEVTITGKVKNQKPTKFNKEYSISRVFWKVAKSLSDAAGLNARLQDIRILSYALHSILPTGVIPMRLTGSANAMETFASRSHIGPTEAIARTEIPPQSRAQDISEISDNTGYLRSDLYNFAFALSASTSDAVKSVTETLSQSIQSAYRMQDVSRRTDDRQFRSSARITSNYAVRTLGQPRERQEPRSPERISPLEQFAMGDESRYLRPRSLKKDVGPSEFVKRTDASEHSATNSVASLQEIYSKYTLHNVFRRSGSGASVLMSETPNLSRPLQTTPRGRKSATISEKELVDSSMVLPSATQLQAMLASHSDRKMGSIHGRLGVLYHDDIITLPVPSTPVRRAAGSYSSSSFGANNVSGQSIAARESAASTFSRRQVAESPLSERRQTSNSIKKETPYKSLSLRELRKMMEQIFQEELKRYGL